MPLHRMGPPPTCVNVFKALYPTRLLAFNVGQNAEVPKTAGPAPSRVDDAALEMSNNKRPTRANHHSISNKVQIGADRNQAANARPP